MLKIILSAAATLLFTRVSAQSYPLDPLTAAEMHGAG
jgi:hypothetical protein